LKAGNDGSTSGPVFEHADWTLFRNLETLGQKAGVAKIELPELVAKELADNACDAAGTCKWGCFPPAACMLKTKVMHYRAVPKESADCSPSTVRFAAASWFGCRPVSPGNGLR